MAIWQFDLLFVPQGAPLPTLDAEGFTNAALMPPDGAALARRWLDQRFAPPHSWADDVLVYGPDQGCRVDLLLLEDGSAEMSCRVDMRGPTQSFVEAICHLAIATSCTLFSLEQRVTFEPKPDVVTQAASNSRAARFVREPAQVLRDIANSTHFSDKA